MIEITKDQADALRAARDKLKAVADDSNEREYLETGDALDAMQDAYNAIDWLFTPRKRTFNVHVRLAEQIEALSEAEAFDSMMERLDGRGGFEIMGHDIIEETEQ